MARSRRRARLADELARRVEPVLGATLQHLVMVDELITTKVGKIDKKALRSDIVERIDSGVRT